MSLAEARIAGQAVPGVQVARAWSAACARNVGRRVLTPRPRWSGRERERIKLPKRRGAEYRRGARRRTGL